jgi:alpha,alpha-trehalose phosphorylase
VILQDAFTVEPWNIRETHLDLDLLSPTESVFALANGHVGWQANLDEGEPHGLRGSYLNGVYESRPLPYAEEAYGLPETGQEVINVTNGELIRLLVDDKPFDVRSGELRSHERLLDFRAGVLSRPAEWTSPAGNLNEFWDRADVEVSGDTEVQQAVRFALFHVLQAGVRAENQAIPARA